MRLRDLYEADISRRDFLRRTGGGAVGMLVGAGMPLQVAQTITAASGPKIFVNVASLFFSYGKHSVGDEVAELTSDYNRLRRMLGRDSEIMATSSNGEDYGVGAYITPEKFAELLKTSDCSKGICDHEDLYYEDLVAPNGLVFEINVKAEGSQGGWPDRMNKIEDNLIADYWNSWARYGATDAVQLDDKTVRYLSKHGVDTTDRPPEEMEQLRELYLKNQAWTKSLGEPTRYGLSLDDPEIRQAYERSIKPEELEQITPHPDERLASPMHQPFERRYFNDCLNQILETYVDEPTAAYVSNNRRAMPFGGGLTKMLEYDPTSGQVSIDGHDMASIAKSMPMMFLRMARRLRVIHGSLGGGKFETFDGQQINCSPLMYRTRENQQMWDSCTQEILDAVSRWAAQVIPVPQGAA